MMLYYRRRTDESKDDLAGGVFVVCFLVIDHVSYFCLFAVFKYKDLAGDTSISGVTVPSFMTSVTSDPPVYTQ